MSEYPYTFAAGRLKSFIESIPSTGVPTKLTTKELNARGYRSSNDRTIIAVLKAVRLIDDQATPTDGWVAYRDRQRGKLRLADLIRQTYSALYAVYPDAHTQPDSSLRNFMGSHSRTGERTVQAMVATFRTLCSLADFEQNEQDAAQDGPPFTDSTVSPTSVLASAKTGQNLISNSPTAMPGSYVSVSNPVPIQVNVQINLPDTDDEQRIDMMLRSVARHLLGRSFEAASPQSNDFEDAESLEDDGDELNQAEDG